VPGLSRYHIVSLRILMVRLPAPIVAVMLLLVASMAHGGAPVPASRGTAILGNAWTANNNPIPRARLRLRNVASGKVAAVTLADEAGRFSFTNIESGSYVVELVNDAAAVLALGHVFSIAPGETVATFVRLGTRVPWFSGFFGNAAGAVASSAASQGITALAPLVRPASSGR
jgi:hypothetical protein